MKKLNQSTIEKLGYYVYLLRDPADKKVFYVGKGKGNRINSHDYEAMVLGEKKTEKLERIRKIYKQGDVPELVILRHGLTEKESFEIEASTIDLLSEGLTNIVGGHDSDERGLMTLKDIELKYQAESAVFKHNVLLIRINKLFTYGMDEIDLYNATRSAWRISTDKLSRLELVCAVYRGIIREVYVPDSWQDCRERAGRKEFIGHKAEESIRNLYINKSVKHILKKGEQTPFRYVCIS